MWNIAVLLGLPILSSAVLFSNSGSHESLLLTVYFCFALTAYIKPLSKVKTWQKCAGLSVCHLLCFLF